MLIARRTPAKSLTPSVTEARSSAILSAFQSLSANDVYQMAPKEYVTRGFAYYRQQRLQGYIWSRDRATLTAEVQGSRVYTVTFSLDQGALEQPTLSTSCDCPSWNTTGPCKHVLCACFTTMNLLSPELFRLPDQQRLHYDKLRTELFAGVPSPARPPEALPHRGHIELVLDARYGYPSLSVHLDGMAVTGGSGWLPTVRLPDELMPLLSPHGFLPSVGEDPFLRYLKRHGDTYPFILETQKKRTTIRWEPKTTCASKTSVNVQGSQVTVRAVFLADGVELDHVVRFRSFVVDVRGSRLLRLDNEQGWQPFFALQQCIGSVLNADDANDGRPRAALLPDQSGLRLWGSQHEALAWTVPLHAFQSVQMDVLRGHADRTVRDLLLTVDGHSRPFRDRTRTQNNATALYRLILMPPSPSTEGPSSPYRLRAECRRQNLSSPPCASVFGLFSLLDQTRISAPLRAWKRKALLYKTYLALLSLKGSTERAQCLKASLQQPEFQRRAVRSEAQGILKNGLSAYQRDDVRIQLQADRWELWPIEKDREVALYRIPCEVFGSEVFRGMTRSDEMVIETQALFQQLPELLERLMDAGIPLLYEDKPVQVSRLDCSLEVSRQAGQTGIDWFEVRPEIRCDGVVVDQTVWHDAVRRGGLMESTGGLLVLDASTLERLRALMALSGQTEPTGKVAARIVQVPRLQIFDWLALREQGITVSLPADDDAILARLMGFERITTPPLPHTIHATLRPYQQDGYGWLSFLYQHRFGACLADDMGLGKTLQVICVLAAIQEGILRPPTGVSGPHLVIVPTSLLFNWEHELARFAPGLKVRVYSGNERVFDAQDAEVVLTTYGVARRDIETLAHITFHVIVLDEAQAVKNIRADTTGAVRRLKGFFKIAMTGTPLENHLGEYFSLIDLCLPGLLGEYDRFADDLKRAPTGVPDRLLRRTRPFVLRRTKDQTLKDLPDKIQTEVRLDFTDRQKALYQQTVDLVRLTIANAYRDKTQAQAQIIALTAILKLRQICLSPRLLTGRTDEPSPKLSFLMEQLQVLREEGHSALVFSQFTSFLDLVEEACDHHAIPHSRLDGSTPLGARKKLVTAFQQSEQPGVFLLSLKAGGQGLNLTHATYVFHLDPWWNPAVENQASDRAHRIGQKRVVTIVRLIMRHTIEEKMMLLKQRKLALYEAVMGGTVRNAGQSALTKSDFEFLLAPLGVGTR